MRAPHRAVAIALRIVTAVIASLVWGLCVPVAIAAHAVDAAAQTPGDHHEDGLAVVGVIVLALVIGLPLAIAGAAALARFLSVRGVVTLLAASLAVFCTLWLSPWVWITVAVAVCGAARLSMARWFPGVGQPPRTVPESAAQLGPAAP